jgi:site-specific recombinase XerD
VKLAELLVPPHMLRRATDYYLANRGEDIRSIQAYLGHRNISHTVRYTEMAPDRQGVLAGNSRWVRYNPWR